MEKRTLASIFVLGMLLAGFIPGAMAEEEGSEPAWFPLLEAGGAIIGILASVITFRNYSNMKGGAVGTGFKFVTIALVSITLGLILRGLNEQFGLMGEFSGELVFETFIYVSVIAIAIGSKKSYDLMK